MVRLVTHQRQRTELGFYRCVQEAGLYPLLVLLDCTWIFHKYAETSISFMCLLGRSKRIVSLDTLRVYRYTIKTGRSPPLAVSKGQN